MGTACEPEIKVTFTNTYYKLIKITIAGSKTWDFLDDNIREFPNSIYVQLLAKGTVVETKEVKPGMGTSRTV